MSAAASLAPALTEIKKQFEQITPYEVRFNFAASSILARQIEHGFKSNLFISANKKWLEYLNQDERLTSTSITPFISNNLVLVRAKKNLKQRRSEAVKKVICEPKSINHPNCYLFSPPLVKQKLMQIQQQGVPLVVADTSHVPLGEYTKEALEHLGLFTLLKKKLVPASNARSTLAFIERGQAVFGIVYFSDAIHSKSIVLEEVIPAAYHSPIVYYLAQTSHKKSQSSKIAEQAFYDFLLLNSTMDVFLQQGFSTLEQN